MARILIVDEEEMSTASLTTHLERQAHVVTNCRDGFEGLAFLSRGIVDLVIADILIPGEDGLGFISSARRSNVRVPIIALTAGPLTWPCADRKYDYRKVARKLGADATLNKPVRWQELQQALSICLGGKRSIEALKL